MSLSRKEALKAMINGRVIKDLNRDIFCYIGVSGLLYDRDKNGFDKINDQGLVLIHDYEIYQEPKKPKRVKLWKFLDLKTSFETSCYWSEDFKLSHFEGSVKESSISEGNWVKTSCFVEVEL